MKRIVTIISIIAVSLGSVANADSEHIIADDNFDVEITEYGKSIFDLDSGWSTTANVSKAAAEYPRSAPRIFRHQSPGSRAIPG